MLNKEGREREAPLWNNNRWISFISDGYKEVIVDALEAISCRLNQRFIRNCRGPMAAFRFDSINGYD